MPHQSPARRDRSVNEMVKKNRNGGRQIAGRVMSLSVEYRSLGVLLFTVCVQAWRRLAGYRLRLWRGKVQLQRLFVFVCRHTFKSSGTHIGLNRICNFLPLALIFEPSLPPQNKVNSLRPSDVISYCRWSFCKHRTLRVCRLWSILVAICHLSDGDPTHGFIHNFSINKVIR